MQRTRASLKTQSTVHAVFSGQLFSTVTCQSPPHRLLLTLLCFFYPLNKHAGNAPCVPGSLQLRVGDTATLRLYHASSPLPPSSQPHFSSHFYCSMWRMARHTGQTIESNFLVGINPVSSRHTEAHQRVPNPLPTPKSTESTSQTKLNVYAMLQWRHLKTLSEAFASLGGYSRD